MHFDIQFVQSSLYGDVCYLAMFTFWSEGHRATRFAVYNLLLTIKMSIH